MSSFPTHNTFTANTTVELIILAGWILNSLQDSCLSLLNSETIGRSCLARVLLWIFTVSPLKWQLGKLHDVYENNHSNLPQV